MNQIMRRRKRETIGSLLSQRQLREKKEDDLQHGGNRMSLLNVRLLVPRLLKALPNRPNG